MVASAEANSVQIESLCDQAQKQAAEMNCLRRPDPKSDDGEYLKNAAGGRSKATSASEPSGKVLMCPVTTTSCISDRERASKYENIALR